MPSFLPFGFFADATGGGGGAAGWASAVVGLGGGFGFAYGDAPDMGSAGEASGRGASKNDVGATGGLHACWANVVTRRVGETDGCHVDSTLRALSERRGPADTGDRTDSRLSYRLCVTCVVYSVCVLSAAVATRLLRSTFRPLETRIALTYQNRYMYVTRVCTERCLGHVACVDATHDSQLPRCCAAAPRDRADYRPVHIHLQHHLRWYM